MRAGRFDVSRETKDQAFAEIDDLQKKINGLKPFTEPMLKQLREYYRVGLTYSSNAIEGNSLTLSETKVVLEDGLTVGGKPLKDHLEARGHSNAYDWLYELANKAEIEEEDILRLHYLFYRYLDEGQAGKYRSTAIIVTGTDFVFPTADEVPGRMEEFVSSMKRDSLDIHTVERAARAHADFVTIHPFSDGNGRVARLIMNLLLFRQNFPITIIPPIRRAEYIAATRKANHGDNEEFTLLIASCVTESQRELLRFFR